MTDQARFRVLFVDDELRLLDGVRRVMRPLRDRWDLVFVDSARAALELLAASPSDVVISDMRMPGMDGAALLDHVARSYPHTIRIILSGQTDPMSVRRLISVAHQFLSKPIDTTALARTITTIEHATGLLRDAELRRLIASANPLRVDARAYDALVACCERPDTPLGDVVAVIETDPAMTARVLQIAGSEFFIGSQSVPEVAEAVQHLGLDVLRSLVFDAELGWPSASDNEAADQRVRRDSLLTARIGRAIAPKDFKQSSYVAGLLHGLGALCAERAETRDAATSVAAGAYLLAIWGFPEPIVRAVKLQDSPERIDSADVLSNALRAARLLAQAVTAAPAADEIPSELGETLARCASGLAVDAAECWRTARTSLATRAATAARTG